MATIDALLREGAPPVIAILRGIAAAEIDAVGGALVKAGIRMIEVPLNSPDPFSSIAALQRQFGDRALIGGGTVLDVASVDRIAASGAGLVVAPNTDAEVISLALERDLEVLPGVFDSQRSVGRHRSRGAPAQAVPRFLRGNALPPGAGRGASGAGPRLGRGWS